MCYENNTSAALLTFGLTLVAAAGSTPAVAQLAPPRGTAAFSGSLVDAIGRALPDKPIVLTSAAASTAVRARSDQAGRFAFTGLPAGDYKLDAEVPGFASEYRIRLADGEHLQRDVALQVGSVQETVSVTAAPPPPPPARRAPMQTSEVSACAQSPTGGCIDPPKKIVDVRPVYPADRGGPSATVRLEGRIGADGFVKALRIVTPADAQFAQAALDAVEQWVFTPTLLDGVPVETPITIAVNFR